MDHDRAQQGGSLLVRGGRYLDVVAGEWRDGDVRILDGRIVEVGSAPGAEPRRGDPRRLGSVTSSLG